MTMKKQGELKRKEILEVIINYIEEHQYAPTVREIGEMIGLKSTSSVHAHINQMIKDGILETDTKSGSPRALRVPGYKFIKVEDPSN